LIPFGENSSKAMTKSNPLVVFALDLMSTYEGEHTIFGLLGQVKLTQKDVEHMIKREHKRKV
jgi:hypothetical protein